MTTVINEAVTNNVVQNDTTKVAFDASKTLSTLETKRLSWESGAYRTSNQELYGILAECLSFCGEDLSPTQVKERRASLEAFYKERGYKYKKELPIVTRVVKAVFGNIDRRRVSTYSLVLRQAQKKKVAYLDLPQWIEEMGGIQEIRLSQSDSFVSPKTKAENAKKAVQGRSFLGFAKSELLSTQADAEFLGDACVLLAEQQADGSFGVRAILRNDGLVNAAYVALYAKQKEALVKAEKELQAANDADGVIAKAA